MPTDRFLIAPYDKESGLETDVEPWLIPDEAFSDLNNVYVWRGRVRKRFGSKWLADNKLGTRFRINIGITDAAGNFVGNVPALLVDAGIPLAIGQAFSIGNEFFTVVSALPGFQNLLDTGTAVLALFDIATGNVNFTGADTPNANVYFYPSFPVMGLLNLEDPNVNNEFIIGFDTRYAYQYNNGWERLNGAPVPNPDNAVWTGNNSQFFWGTTWTGANAANPLFFVTNFNETEPRFLRYFDRAAVGIEWNSFRPQIDATPNYLNAARIIVVFKNRLVFLNTWEGPAVLANQIHYPNRCRYSWIGSPLDATAFRQDLPGHGNAIDCPTTESIITAEFVRDRLIIYFERSTWELVYTGNQAYPFAWQQINTELGAESTFSVIPFDRVAIGVGNVGIHACSGGNVERIDSKIPDTVFAIHNADQGVQRVYGIRDYFVEMLYWTFPSLDTDATFPFPNRILVYNYKNDTWAFNDDSITVFGYLNQPLNIGITWSSTSTSWADPVQWNTGALQTQFRQVIAGNQEGFTFIVDSQRTTNASVMQITDIDINGRITAINHNLRVGDFVYITEVSGTGNYETQYNNRIFEVTNIPTANVFWTLPTPALVGQYNGGGVFARVSRVSLTTKRFNFYQKEGTNLSISKIDFMVKATDPFALCQYDVNYFCSSSTVPILQDGLANDVITGTGTLDTYPYPILPLEATSDRIIHPVYCWADGEFIQINIRMNDAKMFEVIPLLDPVTGLPVAWTGPTFVDFQLDFMMFHSKRTSSRFQ